MCLICFLNEGTPGLHAEYASVPWIQVYAVPNNVSLRTAGAGLLQGAYYLPDPLWPVKLIVHRHHRAHIHV